MNTATAQVLNQNTLYLCTEKRENAIESLGSVVEHLEIFDPTSVGNSKQVQPSMESSSGQDMTRRDHLAKAVEVLHTNPM